MNLFVYEFVTGGGFGNVSGNCVPSPTLRREGLAMAAALTADFAKIDDVHVVTTWDARAQRRSDDFAPGVSVEPVGSPTEESTVFGRLLAECDRAVIIAPETDGILHERSRAAGDKLLGSSLDVIALATNKWRMHEHLRSHGVPTPRSIALSDPPRRDELAAVGFPAVIKPIDGCGSQDVVLVASREQIERMTLAWPAADSTNRGATRWLIEEYCPGYPASVAVLCGPHGVFPLRPCWQRLSDDGCFRYLGGATMPLGSYCDRALALALQVARALPDARGYLGIDIVLGDRTSAGRAHDVVIEINPRLTTSYVGLRRATSANLALAMLHADDGQDVSPPFDDVGVEFDAEGICRPAR